MSKRLQHLSADDGDELGLMHVHEEGLDSIDGTGGNGPAEEQPASVKEKKDEPAFYPDGQGFTFTH